MVYLKDKYEIDTVINDLKNDQKILTVGHVHLNDKHIQRRIFHEGHKQYVRLAKAKCDVLIASMVPVPPFPFLKSIVTPSSDPTRFADTARMVPHTNYEDKKLTLSREDIDFVENELPEIDYMYTVHIDGAEAKRAFVLNTQQAPPLSIQNVTIPTTLSHEGTLHDMFYRMTFGWFIRKPLFPLMPDKLIMFGSRKDSIGRLQLWKLWTALRDENKTVLGLGIRGKPRTELEPKHHWMVPLYIDAEGLVPEYQEPIDIRNSRKTVRNIIATYTGTSAWELNQAIQEFSNLPEGYRVDVCISDYETLERLPKEIFRKEDRMPVLGEVQAHIINDQTGEVFEVWYFIGQDSAKYFDIRTHQEFI